MEAASFEGSTQIGPSDGEPVETASQAITDTAATGAVATAPRLSSPVVRGIQSSARTSRDALTKLILEELPTV